MFDHRKTHKLTIANKKVSIRLYDDAFDT